MVEELTEIRLTWGQAIDYASKQPTVSKLRKLGRPVVENDLRVLVPADHKNFVQMKQMRNWLYKNEFSYELLSRYALDQEDFEVTKKCLGLVFAFSDQEQCALFKNFWV